MHEQMDRFSERAEWLAAASWWRQRQGGALSVLPRWTAWLLLRRAGVSIELIAEVYKRDARHIHRRVQAATALMVWPPYAARIESMTRQMPRFAAAEQPGLKPAMEAPCVAQAG